MSVGTANDGNVDESLEGLFCGAVCGWRSAPTELIFADTQTALRNRVWLVCLPNYVRVSHARAVTIPNMDSELQR